jgi:hypothetical protein
MDIAALNREGPSRRSSRDGVQLTDALLTGPFDAEAGIDPPVVTQCRLPPEIGEDLGGTRSARTFCSGLKGTPGCGSCGSRMSRASTAGSLTDSAARVLLPGLSRDVLGEARETAGQGSRTSTSWAVLPVAFREGPFWEANP